MDGFSGAFPTRMEFHSLLMEFHSFVLVLLITNVIKVRMLIKIQKLEGQKKEMRRTTTTTPLERGVSIFNVRRNLVVQVKCLCRASSNSQNTRYANVHVHKLLFKKGEWCTLLSSHMTHNTVVLLYACEAVNL